MVGEKKTGRKLYSETKNKQLITNQSLNKNFSLCFFDLFFKEQSSVHDFCTNSKSTDEEIKKESYTTLFFRQKTKVFI